METLKNYNQFKCNVTQEGGKTTNRINQKVFFCSALPILPELFLVRVFVLLVALCE